jgi:hypothetical protein
LPDERTQWRALSCRVVFHKLAIIQRVTTI